MERFPALNPSKTHKTQAACHALPNPLTRCLLNNYNHASIRFHVDIYLANTGQIPQLLRSVPFLTFEPKPASTAFLFRSILGYFAVLDLKFPTRSDCKSFWRDYKIHQNPTSRVLQVGSSASVSLFFSFEAFLLCKLYPNSSGFVGEGNDPNKGTKMSIVRSYQES